MTVAIERTQDRGRRWLHAAWILLFALIATPTLVFLWEKWTRSIWLNGHGILVPLIVAFLAYDALSRHPEEREEPSAWGFALLIPSLFLIALDSAIKTELLAAFALLLSLPGLSLLLLGRKRTRALLFPFFISFFMLPIPAALMVPIHLRLREITTVGTEWLLREFGMPVVAEQTYLFLPHGTLRVVEECSGFSALYAAVTTALVLAYLSDSRRRSILLLAMPVPLALGSNVLRIAGLALLAERVGYEVLATPAHVLSGFLTFILALVPLFLCAGRGAGSASD